MTTILSQFDPTSIHLQSHGPTAHGQWHPPPLAAKPGVPTPGRKSWETRDFEPGEMVWLVFLHPMKCMWEINHQAKDPATMTIHQSSSILMVLLRILNFRTEFLEIKRHIDSQRWKEFLDMVVSWNRGTPSHHPFKWHFMAKNTVVMGVPPMFNRQPQGQTGPNLAQLPVLRLRPAARARHQLLPGLISGFQKWGYP